jgi:hypothetical protein
MRAPFMKRPFGEKAAASCLLAVCLAPLPPAAIAQLPGYTGRVHGNSAFGPVKGDVEISCKSGAAKIEALY